MKMPRLVKRDCVLAVVIAGFMSSESMSDDSGYPYRTKCPVGDS